MANTVRGHIEQLPSGSFRVHVYAGTDPVTGRPRRLRETCPDEAAAAATLGRLLNEADGGRFPNRAATLSQALDKYLEVTALELSDQRGASGLYSSHHRAGSRGREGSQARRRLPRQPVHGIKEVLTTLRQTPEDRAPHRW